jgi:hypothetical protein
MRNQLTRRQAAAALGAAAAASSPAAARQANPAEAQDDLTIQRANLKRNAEMLAKLKLPRDLEPAFQFKA